MSRPFAAVRPLEAGRRAGRPTVWSVGLILLIVGTITPAAAGSGSMPAAPLSCGFGVGVTATPSAGATPLLVQFNATVTSGAPSSYNWSFGDGSYWNSSVTGADRPYHRYATVGLYNASVSVVETGCTAAASVSIAAVEGPLTALLSARPDSGAAPLSVVFNSSVTGGTGTYLTATWRFGDGGVGSGLNVVYTYASEGRFIAVLNITDSAGHWTIATAEVNVSGSSAPGPSAAARVVPYALSGAGATAGLVAGFLLYRRSRRPLATRPRSDRSPDATSRDLTPRDHDAPSTAMIPSASNAPPGPATQGSEPTILATDRSATAPSPTGGGARTPRVEAPADGLDRLRLTQRVILHVGQQGLVGPDEVAPVGLTQAGMAEALGVSQNSLTNVLRRLVAASVLSQDVRHVHGRPRRLRVYRFTARGESLYRELRRTNASGRGSRNR